MKLVVLLGSIWLSFSSTAAGAFTRMGGPTMEPYCALACCNVLGMANLTCTMTMNHGGGHVHGMDMSTPECRGNDDAYLTSLAYYFEQQCPDKLPRLRLFPDSKSI
jgi:hypothetical protein